MKGAVWEVIVHYAVKPSMFDRPDREEELWIYTPSEVTARSKAIRIFKDRMARRNIKVRKIQFTSINLAGQIDG